MPVADLGPTRGVNATALLSILRHAGRLTFPNVGRIFLAVERVHAMPKQGIVSTFNFGRTYGAIEAVAHLFQPTEIRYVSPEEWTVRVCGRTHTSKDDRRYAARTLYPACSEKLTRAKDHNRADAVLIAHWYYTSLVLKGEVAA